MNGSPLTLYQQLCGSLQSVDDLAVGYPKLIPFSEQWHRLQEYLFAATRSMESASDALDTLTSTAKSVLGISADLRCVATFSGSVALERVISAIVPGDRQAIVTVPGFDSINSFVERASKRRPGYVEWDPFGDRDQAVESLSAAIDASVGSVVLVSPNNPSGFALTNSEICRIADDCAKVDAVLIMDHCFMLMNPFGADLGEAFSLGNRCRWVSLWDSSKTIELLGEKVGFIFGSADELRRIERLVSEIQLDLPWPTMIAMTEALRQLMDGDMIPSANRVIRENLIRLQAACIQVGLRVNSPDAGSFALVGLDTARFRSSSSSAEQLLTEFRVAVMPSKYLYPIDFPWRNEFLRVSLARPAEMIENVCRSLLQLERTQAM